MRVWLSPFLACMFLAGCSSDGTVRKNPFRDQERVIEKLSAEQLYKSGRASLDSGDNASALDFYQRLDARYPFTPYATQGQLETIYAHHRAFGTELALTAAARFIKQHPRHAAIDYVYYLRGLIYQSQIEEGFEELLGVDSTRRSPDAARQAFDAFGLLIQRYPTSRYSSESRQRMVYLRGILARYELNIAEYYLRRRAYVASSRRAQLVLDKYQGTPSVARALDVLRESYAELGLKDLATNADKMLRYNFPKYDGQGKTPFLRWPFGKKKDASAQTPPALKAS
ncbi:MAG: outer membrane protein assembly factor BamD [Nevskiales bacterium]